MVDEMAQHIFPMPILTLQHIR